MATQHASITDANRHEAKGASTASNGQVLKANGDGSTSFVNPSTLTNVSITNVLTGIDLTIQNPSAVDVALPVTFGNAVAATDVSLSSGGVLTFNTTGFYVLDVNLNFQRTAAVGLAKLVSRILVNGTAIDPTYYTILTDLATAQPLYIHLERTFNATNTLTVEVLRDSSGIDNGGLYPLDPVLAGWNTSPSAYIKVQKMVGVA